MATCAHCGHEVAHPSRDYASDDFMCAACYHLTLLERHRQHILDSLRYWQQAWPEVTQATVQDWLRRAS